MFSDDEAEYFNPVHPENPFLGVSLILETPKVHEGLLQVDYALVGLPGFNNDVIDLRPDVAVGLTPKALLHAPLVSSHSSG